MDLDHMRQRAADDLRRRQLREHHASLRDECLANAEAASTPGEALAWNEQAAIHDAWVRDLS